MARTARQKATTAGILGFVLGGAALYAFGDYLCKQNAIKYGCPKTGGLFTYDPFSVPGQGAFGTNIPAGVDPNPGGGFIPLDYIETGMNENLRQYVLGTGYIY